MSLLSSVHVYCTLKVLNIIVCVRLVGFRPVVIWRVSHGGISDIYEKPRVCSHVLPRRLCKDDRWQFQTKYAILSND